MKIDNRMFINRGAIVLGIVLVSIMVLTIVFFAPQTFASETEATPNDITAVTDNHSAASIHLNKISTYTGDGAEIPAFDPTTERLFVVAGDDFIDVIDMSDPLLPTQAMTISLSSLGAGANSVAVSNGYVAVAIESAPAQDDGVRGVL